MFKPNEEIGVSFRCPARTPQEIFEEITDLLEGFFIQKGMKYTSYACEDVRFGKMYSGEARRVSGKHLGASFAKVNFLAVKSHNSGGGHVPKFEQEADIYFLVKKPDGTDDLTASWRERNSFLLYLTVHSTYPGA